MNGARFAYTLFYSSVKPQLYTNLKIKVLFFTVLFFKFYSLQNEHLERSAIRDYLQ